MYCSSPKSYILFIIPQFLRNLMMALICFPAFRPSFRILLENSVIPKYCNSSLSRSLSLSYAKHIIRTCSTDFSVRHILHKPVLCLPIMYNVWLRFESPVHIWVKMTCSFYLCYEWFFFSLYSFVLCDNAYLYDMSPSISVIQYCMHLILTVSLLFCWVQYLYLEHPQ